MLSVPGHSIFTGPDARPSISEPNTWTGIIATAQKAYLTANFHVMRAYPAGYVTFVKISGGWGGVALAGGEQTYQHITHTILKDAFQLSCWTGGSPAYLLLSAENRVPGAAAIIFA